MKQISDNIKPFFIALICTLFCLESCSPYEDGPGISFRSKDSRLYFNGRTFTSYMVNGVDSTAEVIELVSDSLEANGYSRWAGTLSTFESFSSSEENILLGLGSTFEPLGYFGFANNDKTECTFIFAFLPNSGPSNYEIRRLSKSELWLERNINGKRVEIRIEE